MILLGNRSPLLLLLALVAGALTLPAFAFASTARLSALYEDEMRVPLFVYEAGAGEPNELTVAQTVNWLTGNATVTFTDRGAAIAAGAGCTSTASDSVACSINIYAYDADYADLTVRAADLDDAVVVGRGDLFLFATLVGGPGNDTLRGGSENDVLLGGPGSDVLTGGGHQAVSSVYAGGDILDYRGRVNPVRVTPDGLPNDGEAGELDNVAADIEDILGGRGGDVLVGTAARNYISAGGGNDIVKGRGGNDTIRGGRGADRLFGGDGHEWLDGGWGPDMIASGQGRDFIFGGVGNDRLFGGSRADDILGSSGDDVISGGAGRDRVEGHSGRDVFWMRDGSRDRVFGGSDRDRARIDRALDVVSDVERLF